ncbi:MAG: hypothetical protein NC905_05930 [Candidatus Omnitrophica bacterium]|nr:hypothetical protein [Candidatus Omnitrophota bacterium]
MEKMKICLLLIHEGIGKSIFDDKIIDELKKVGDVSIWDGKMSVQMFCKGADIIITTWGVS